MDVGWTWYGRCMDISGADAEKKLMQISSHEPITVNITGTLNNKTQ